MRWEKVLFPLCVFKCLKYSRQCFYFVVNVKSTQGYFHFIDIETVNVNDTTNLLPMNMTITNNPGVHTFDSIHVPRVSSYAVICTYKSRDIEILPSLSKKVRQRLN